MEVCSVKDISTKRTASNIDHSIIWSEEFVFRRSGQFK